MGQSLSNNWSIVRTVTTLGGGGAPRVRVTDLDHHAVDFPAQHLHIFMVAAAVVRRSRPGSSSGFVPFVITIVVAVAIIAIARMVEVARIEVEHHGLLQT